MWSLTYECTDNQQETHPNDLYRPDSQRNQIIYLAAVHNKRCESQHGACKGHRDGHLLVIFTIVGGRSHTQAVQKIAATMSIKMDTTSSQVDRMADSFYKTEKINYCLERKL